MKDTSMRDKTLSTIKKTIMSILGIAELIGIGVVVYLLFIRNVWGDGLFEKIMGVIGTLCGCAGISFAINNFLEWILPFSLEHKEKRKKENEVELFPKDEQHKAAISSGKICEKCVYYEPFLNGPLPGGDGVCHYWETEKVSFMGNYKDFKVRSTSTCDKFLKKDTSSDAHFKK